MMLSSSVVSSLIGGESLVDAPPPLIDDAPMGVVIAPGVVVVSPTAVDRVVPPLPLPFVTLLPPIFVAIAVVAFAVVSPTFVFAAVVVFVVVGVVDSVDSVLTVVLVVVGRGVVRVGGNVVLSVVGGGKRHIASLTQSLGAALVEKHDCCAWHQLQPDEMQSRQLL